MERIKCPECTRAVTLRESGSMRAHPLPGEDIGRCIGSGRTLAEAYDYIAARGLLASLSYYRYTAARLTHKLCFDEERVVNFMVQRGKR